MATGAIAKGSASISVNPQETEAVLAFVPDAGGNPWDAAAVNRLAGNHHLGSHPDPAALETFLQKAAKAKEPLEMVICRGIAPEEPAAEKVNWEALPVPSAMAAFQEEALAGAGAPHVYCIKTERIRHEKKIKKPGALPFMPEKEEILVTWEKKETREEVNVNPEFREIKYADKGAKLGTLVPSVPGKPGKSVYGRPIPPQNTASSAFPLGDGIGKNKNDLTALVSGFLRIGENWADMVPVSRPVWSMNAGISKSNLFLHFEGGDARFALPTGEEILAVALEKGGSEDSLISAAEIDAAIAESVKSRKPLESFPLFLTREAAAKVEINPEKTRAVLYLRKGTGGAPPLDMRMISNALKESGVHGFDADALKAAVQAFLEGKDPELKEYVLAEGKPSTRGKDREVEVQAALLQDDEKERFLKRLSEWSSRGTLIDEGIDPQKAAGFALVEKGTAVARVLPGSEGEAGKDIYGNIVPGLPGNDPDLKLFHGLELHGSAITASKKGLLLFEASEKSFRGTVIDYLDAQINVHISDDAMEATGEFVREEGAGLPLTVENVQKVLAQAGITKGINWETVEKACIQAREKGSAAGFILARGKPPLAPGGSDIKWLVPLTQAADSKTAQVKAGAVIAVLSAPAAEGRPGYDVRGTAIPIDAAPVSAMEHDDSIQEETQAGGKRFIAARSGELVYDGRELKIGSVRRIEGDAGPAGGKINFPGEIQITGNVLPGCVIIGGSHVTVDGLAEEALISAGGKALVALGFKGGDKGIIRARAAIVTAFAERASLLAVGDIHLKKGSIRSTIKTNGKLYITDGNGKLSGGICQARHGLDVMDVGSEKNIRTEISFGQDYLIKDQIHTGEEEIIKLRRSLSEIEEKIKTALGKKLPIPDEVRKEKVRLVKLMEQLNLKIFTLREKFEEHHESEIRIRGSVFPGVVMESHDRYYEVKHKRSKVIFYFDRETGSIKEKLL